MWLRYADLYRTAIVPIGVAFALVLWMGNAAYLYLSVSFIQMIKALMPLSVRCSALMVLTADSAAAQWILDTGRGLARHQEVDTAADDCL